MTDLPACWPPEPDTPIGDDCAQQIVAYLKTVTPPAIAFCRQLIREQRPDAVIAVHGLTASRIADTRLHPAMDGLAIIVVSARKAGMTRIISIALDRDGVLTWKWILPVDLGSEWRRIGER